MRALKHRRSMAPETVSTEGWLVTFSDLLFLLLTFFVMKFSTLSFAPLSLPVLAGLSDPQREFKTANNAGRVRVFEELRTGLTEMLGEIPAGQGRNASLRFVSGLQLVDAGDSIRLLLPISTGELEQQQFAFRTAGMIKLIGRVAANRNFEITTVPFNSKKVDGFRGQMWLLSGAIRQFIDAGVDPRAIKCGTFDAEDDFSRVSFTQNGISDKGIEFVLLSAKGVVGKN